MSSQEALTVVPPRDKFRIVYITLITVGIGIVLPWNAFLNANDYFVRDKLADVKNGPDMSVYRYYYLQIVGTLAALANLVVQVGNIFLPAKASSLKLRVIVAIAIEMVIILMTTIFAAIDTTSWQEAFFWVTMISVIFLNMAAGAFQNSAMAIPAKLPPKYMNAIIIGMNSSGAALSIALIISLAVSSDIRGAAIIYFASSFAFLIIVMGLYSMLSRNAFYSFYSNDADINDQDDQKPEKVDLKKIVSVFKTNWIMFYNIFFMFWVTLSIFPAIQAGVQPLDGIISPKYFVAVTTFMTFNSCALSGNILAGYVKLAPEKLWMAVTSTILFIPAFLFCNYIPPTGRTLMVIFSSDWVFWILAVFLGVSSGFLSSLGIMYASYKIPEENAPIAGMLGGISIITGVSAGICTCFIWPHVV